MGEKHAFADLRQEMAASLDEPMTVGIFLTMIEPIFNHIKELEGAGIRYRGVFQRADAYRRGDVITCDGSAWIAIADTAGVKPGEGAAWHLMVKAGRDGRDGRVRA